MITVSHVTKKFPGRTALNDVSFTVERGEIIGMLGPNGAGKTTAMRILAGYFPPTGGTVKIDDLELFDHPVALKRRIGYLPEHCALPPELRITEYLRFQGGLYGLGYREKRARIAEVLNQCGLDPVARRMIGHLSRGYRQRVGLAATLLHRPDLLLLDEPTIGLDPAQTREVRDLIRGLGQHHTVLLSTHLLPEVESLCDRILILQEGRMIAAGTIHDLRRRAGKSLRMVIEAEDSPGLSERIGKFLHVRSVEAAPLPDGWQRLTVKLERIEGARESLLQGLCLERLAIREFREQEQTLEDLFLTLTSGSAGR